MKRHRLVLATAESCTAGLIAAHLADVKGAGDLLESAFVVYASLHRTTPFSARQQRSHATLRCVGLSLHRGWHGQTARGSATSRDTAY